MSNVNVNKNNSIKIIKNFIQDLSFENPQNINENNSVNNNNNDIDVNMNVVYKPYNNNFFSLNLKYTLDCSSKKNKKKLFFLELDYFGFFEILETNNHNQKLLTEKGIKLLFPFVKEIIEDITRKGGSVPILLNEVNFNLKKD
jgi:preprotein translocase subunit SecB